MWMWTIHEITYQTASFFSFIKECVLCEEIVILRWSEFKSATFWVKSPLCPFYKDTPSSTSMCTIALSSSSLTICFDFYYQRYIYLRRVKNTVHHHPPRMITNKKLRRTLIKQPPSSLFPCLCARIRNDEHNRMECDVMWRTMEGLEKSDSPLKINIRICGQFWGKQGALELRWLRVHFHSCRYLKRHICAWTHVRVRMGVMVKKEHVGVVRTFMGWYWGQCHCFLNAFLRARFPFMLYPTGLFSLYYE